MNKIEQASPVNDMMNFADATASRLDMASSEAGNDEPRDQEQGYNAGRVVIAQQV